MKKVFHAVLMAGLLAVVFSSCKSSKSAQAATAKSEKKSVKGTWVLNNISFEGVPKTARITTVFNNIPYKCLEGSVWTLPNATANGTYAITSGETGCSPVTQNIVWSTYDRDGIVYFQFKELLSGVKAKNTPDGYRVELTSVDNNSMTWRAPVNIDGQTAYINYSLSRR
ncbi:hypothetical protein MKQ70_24820 [Chitinophaga sedimenti]|jgi:hypothetical protein|uniref:hypothetical protein n=1 Tax=Chitinophaga sedimenti TaxID=2033606 RepID=UPI00200387DA|nr:hypothetical protein [Chitinophaga sedimenti]MCK7558054.1 hypothetical protein [Chitinophaga sedimenti]